MEAREFVAIVKHHAADGAVNDILRNLNSKMPLPPLPELGGTSVNQDIARYALRAQREKHRRATWFQQLPPADQAEIAALLRDCAEATAGHFFAILDGVGQTPGVFEVVEVDGRKRRILNPENSEMLHDLFFEVCESERE